MPKIYLKPNSPEFAEKRQDSPLAQCDMPGCTHMGENKAPKHRGLNDYYWFCAAHVAEYNRAWNFFEGMPASEVQDHIHKSMYGDRPTWKYGVGGKHFTDDLYKKAQQTYTGEDEYRKEKSNWDKVSENAHTPEFEALAIMGLEPPITLPDIKKRYKDLAKKHHPDLNKGCKKSEDILKKINMAYTILKLSYEKFEKLPER